MEKTHFLIPGSLYPIMTAQEEQQVAQQFVEDYQLAKGEPFTDDPEDNRVITSLDLLSMAKHLCNIAKLASDMMTQEALQLTNTLIDNHASDDNGEPIAVNKQFVFHGNKWMYQVKETYNRLGSQRLPDGTIDPNSCTYHSLEVQQEQMRKDSKALTAQMAGLKERILNDHPKLQPTDVSVSLALKGQA